MGEDNSNFAPLFANGELLHESFIFIFAAKDSRNFGFATYR